VALEARRTQEAADAAGRSRAWRWLWRRGSSGRRRCSGAWTAWRPDKEALQREAAAVEARLEGELEASKKQVSEEGGGAQSVRRSPLCL